MLELLAEIGRGAVDLLALPLAAWTAVALVAEAALRMTRASAALALPVRGSVLAALPLAVLVPGVLAALAPEAAVFAIVPDPLLWLPEVAAGAPADAVAGAAPPLLDVLLGLAVIGALAVTLVHALRLGAALAAVRRTRRALPAAGPDARASVERACALFGVTRPVSAAQAPPGVAPFTVGVRRPLVALPADLGGDARDLAALHEVAHVRRADAGWHAAQQAVAAVFGAHPLVWALGRGLDLDRERAADAAVLAARPDRRRAYAALLFSYAALPAPALSLGAVGGSSALKTRIDAMTRPHSPARARRLARLGRLVGLVTVVATVAVAAAAGAPPPTADAPPTAAARLLDGIAEAGGPLTVSDTTDVYEVADVQPQLIGGLEGLQSRVVYPDLAKRAGIQGEVVVQFVVTPEGTVRDAEAVRSPHEMLGRAAVAAVADARFSPGRQDGQPVAVRFAVPISFELPEGEAADGTERRLLPDPLGEDGVYGVVDEMPVLIGGIAGLQARLVYPPLAKDAGIEGQLVIQFVVDEEGRVQDAAVLRTPDAMLSEAALDAVRASTFEPGRVGGDAVKVRFAVPITFRLPAGDGVDRGEYRQDGSRRDRPATERPASDRAGYRTDGSRTDGGTVHFSGVDLARLSPDSRQRFEASIASLPDAFARDGVAAGTATVRYTVRADGRPSNLETTRGDGALRDAAEALVGTLRTAVTARPGADGSWTGSFRLVYYGEG